MNHLFWRKYLRLRYIVTALFALWLIGFFFKNNAKDLQIEPEKPENVQKIEPTIADDYQVLFFHQDKKQAEWFLSGTKKWGFSINLIEYKEMFYVGFEKNEQLLELLKNKKIKTWNWNAIKK